MNSISAQNLVDRQRNKLWQAEGTAYLLAILAHAAVFQIYNALPPPLPAPEPPLIEATLIVDPAPAAAAAPAPPQPQVKPPPPVPKPAPKVEKPVQKKMDMPKPVPKPKPKPVAKPAPSPRPEPQEEAESRPSPVHEPVYEAPAAPVEAPRAAPKAPPAPVENTQYHPGHVSGFGRNNYPKAAKEMGWEGTVTLKVHILADGDIGEVIVTGSSGHEILDDAAVGMVKEAHATPARRGDNPVDSWVVVPYRFHLDRE